MARQFASQAEFHDKARAGRGAGVPVSRSATIQRAATDGSRVVRWTLSDGSIDRMGDSINPNGWDLTNYTANPVILWAHDSSAPPIGRMVRTWVEGGKLVGDVEFASAETYQFADDIFRLVQAGFINAGSVGFLPTEYAYTKDPDRPYGIDFTAQELLEFSIAPVPANANALSQARAKGLRVDPLQGRVARASASQAARLREWAREGNDPAADARLQRALALQRGLSSPMDHSDDRSEEQLAAAARRLALAHLRDAADLTTRTGRTLYARRLKAAHEADGGRRSVDPRIAAAAAIYRSRGGW